MVNGFIGSVFESSTQSHHLSQKTAVRRHQCSLPAPTRSHSPSSTQNRERIDTPNEFTSTLPRVKPERERRREKKGRGGAGEVKCVLRMAGLPLAAQLHSHVCGRADVLREDGQAVVWKSKMAAKLHIIKLSCVPHQNVSKPPSNQPPLHVQTHF